MKVDYIVCDIETTFNNNVHTPTMIGSLTEEELVIFRDRSAIMGFFFIFIWIWL